MVDKAKSEIQEISTGAIKKAVEILSETRIEADPEKVLNFFRSLNLTNNIKGSALASGVNYETARTWVNKPFAERLIDICKVEAQKELDRSLTGLITDVISSLQERLEVGDYNNQGKRIPVQMDKLLKALSVLYDKRALIRGEPTSRVERVSTEQRLKKLSKRFEQLPKQTQEFIVDGLEEQDNEESYH